MNSPLETPQIYWTGHPLYKNCSWEVIASYTLWKNIAQGFAVLGAKLWEKWWEVIRDCRSIPLEMCFIPDTQILSSPCTWIRNETANFLGCARIHTVMCLGFYSFFFFFPFFSLPFIFGKLIRASIDKAHCVLWDCK